MKHLIFDTETTRLVGNSLQPLEKQPRIIEIFAMVLDDSDWREVASLHYYIDPGIPLPAIVTKITGITDEMVRGKPKFGQVADEIEGFFSQADRVVAHNVSYDKQVLDFEFWRLGREFPWAQELVCTVESSESIRGHRLNLTALHEHLFGEGFAKAHSAENDVRATARCYVELVKRGEI